MSEARMWHDIRQALQEPWPNDVFGDAVFFMRMENLVGPGTPDIYLNIKGHCCWIECKEVAVLPVHPTSKVKFGSPFKIEQLDWHKRLQRAGGFSIVLVKLGKGKSRMWWAYRNQELGDWLVKGPTLQELARRSWVESTGKPNLAAILAEALLFGS